jgi:hypothetical protein
MSSLSVLRMTNVSPFAVDTHIVTGCVYPLYIVEWNHFYHTRIAHEQLSHHSLLCTVTTLFVLTPQIGGELRVREFLAGAGSLCCPNALMFLGHYAELISIRGFVLLLGSNTPGEKVEP